MEQQQLFKSFAYVSDNPTCLQTTIPGCKDLRKLKLQLDKTKKNEERATKLKEDYLKKLDYIITPFYISNADFSSYKIYNTFYYIFQNSGMFRNFN